MAKSHARGTTAYASAQDANNRNQNNATDNPYRENTIFYLF